MVSVNGRDKLKGRYSPIVQVLNGIYPASAIHRMRKTCLEKFVTKLVQCTADVVGSKKHNKKPKWWPNEIEFNNPVKFDLCLLNNKDVCVILRQLVVNCSQFYKSCAFRAQWLPTIDRRDFLSNNNENCSPNNDKKRKRSNNISGKKIKQTIYLDKTKPISKEEFMCYFELDMCCERNGGKMQISTAPTNGSHCVIKLGNSTNIPLSSDIGRAMALKDQHYTISEDLKLKRLDRSEWYTNKSIAKNGTETAFPQTLLNDYNNKEKRLEHFHWYKPPKRQYYQTRSSLHSRQFFELFCTPVYVKLERLESEKNPRKGTNILKKPVVWIENLKFDEKLQRKKFDPTPRTSSRLL